MSDRNGSGSLASSLTDLMTSLMIIFVLLLVATLNNASVEGQSTRNRILEDLKHDLRIFSSQGIQVEQDPADPLALIVLVPSGLLDFSVDGATVPPKGVEFLNEFSPLLAGVTCGKYRHDISSIVVEGHTDSTGTDEHNLALSQQRSLAVVQQTLAALDANDKACFLDFLSATGRGSREPILSPVTGKEDMDRSRRVIFKIRVRSFEQREFRSVLGAD